MYGRYYHVCCFHFVSSSLKNINPKVLCGSILKIYHLIYFQNSLKLFGVTFFSKKVTKHHAAITKNRPCYKKQGRDNPRCHPDLSDCGIKQNCRITSLHFKPCNGSARPLGNVFAIARILHGFQHSAALSVGDRLLLFSVNADKSIGL